MLKSFRLAATLLWREWRTGEWFIVFIALLLAITATTSIHFYTDRVVRGLDQQSARFLGGDLVVTSPSPIPLVWEQKALSLQLQTAQVWSYPSVANAKNQLQLINLQAISNTYPLIGNTYLHISPNTVWVEPRLLPLLSIHLTDTLGIGAANFRTEKMLTNDVDALNTGWQIAPRVMMRLEDVPATRTVLPGSRVDYRLLLVGNKNQLQLFRDWIKPQLTAGQTLLDITSQQFVLKNILQRAENYLQLVLLVCLMMSGVAIALSIQQYLHRHYSHVALWRCLGAKQKQITHILLWQLTIIALSAGLIAVGLGYIAQSFFAEIFKNILQFPLPAASSAPLILGLFSSVFLLFTFAYPVIYELPRTSPLHIWREEIGSHPIRHFYLIISLLLLFVFIFWYMNFSLLTFLFISYLIIGIAFLYTICALILFLLKLIVENTDGVVRRGLSQLVQYPRSISLQFVGFNLIIIALIVLGLVRTHIIENWQQSLPKHTPNYFAINIAPSDLTSLKEMLVQNQVAIEWIYPMIRGRLIALNDKAILSVIPVEAQSNNALHRELNLSWMEQFPSDNKIISGTSWKTEDAGKNLVSVENNLAQTLHLHLGDKLTFQIGDQQISAVIRSFRSVDWSSFHPNFFMIFPPGLLNNFAATYITSFHLLVNQTTLLNQLIQQFPNITIIDVASLLQQVQALVSKVTLAIQYLFLFALGAGVLIFITSLQASLDIRKQTYHLMRVLGAGKKYISRSLIVEFGVLILLIGITSVSLSYLLVHYLEQAIFF